MKKILKILFFPFVLLLSACGLLGVKESIVIADAKSALEEKYKETFEILKVKRIINTGAGITKSYELICVPVKDERLEFHSTVTYDTEDGKFRMKFDTYTGLYLGKIVNEALKDTIQQAYDGDFNSALSISGFGKTLENVNLQEHFGMDKYQELLRASEKDWAAKLYIDLPKEEHKPDELYYDLIRTAFRFLINSGHKSANVVLRFYDADFFANNKADIENFRFRLRNVGPRPNERQEIENWWVGYAKNALDDVETFLKDVMPKKVRKIDNYLRQSN